MGKAIGESRLSMKAQITIPKTVRVLLDLKPGDTVAFIYEDNRVYIEKKQHSKTPS